MLGDTGYDLSYCSIQKDGTINLYLVRRLPNQGFQYVIMDGEISRREVYFFVKGLESESEADFAKGKEYVGWEYADSYGNKWIYFSGSFNKNSLVTLKSADGELMNLYSPPVYQISESRFSPDIYIDGKRLEYADVRPFVTDGRTYVPIRVIAESLGWQVSWNGAEKSVSITNNGKTIVFDDEIVIKNGRTFVPLRTMFESLDMFVRWLDEYAVIEVY